MTDGRRVRARVRSAPEDALFRHAVGEESFVAHERTVDHEEFRNAPSGRRNLLSRSPAEAPTQRGTNSAKHQPPGREMRGLSVRQGFEALDERHSGGVDLPCPLSGLLPSGAAQQTVQPEQESSVRGECGPRGDMDARDCGFHGFT